MGVFNPASGTEASVMVGSVTMRFSKFDFDVDVKDVAVNNFSSAQQLLTFGLGKGKVTLSGPYDIGNMPLEAGNVYVVTLNVNEDVSFVCPCMLNHYKISDDVEDAPRITCDFNSTGTFSMAVT
jgi:hypothetical protein